MATSYRMMNDPDVLTQCIDLDLEFETPACSQPFQPIRMDSQLEREPGVCFCILADSAESSLAKPVTNDMPDSQEVENPVTADLAPEFEAVAEKDLGERTPKRLKRSNAFLEDSYDAKAAHYDGVKHFNVLALKPTLNIDTVATPQKGEQASGSNEIPGPSAEAPSAMSGGVPGEDPGAVNTGEVPGEDPGAGTEPNTGDDEEAQKKKERKAEMKRISSNKWHEKWISKGVPRAPKDESQSQSEPSSRPANMRDACAQFVSKWINESGMQPSNDRRKKAYEAWMSSDERSKLLAGKSNVQG